MEITHRAYGHPGLGRRGRQQDHRTVTLVLVGVMHLAAAAGLLLLTGVI